MNQIDPSQIENGDILIYENQEYSLGKFLSKVPFSDLRNLPKWNDAAFYILLYIIPWCDPGKDPAHYKNIYHAAIWGSLKVNGETKTGVVGAGRSGIGIGGLGLTADTVKNIYVYRSNQSGFDGNRTDASLQAFYEDRDIKYAYDTAWLLAIMCSLRYKDGTLHDLIDRNIGYKWLTPYVIMAIQGIINDYMLRHQKDMVVCSTLVSMAYENAGFPLRVHPFEKPNMDLLPEISLEELSEMTEVEPTTPLTVQDFPDIEIPESLVTPRQLFESPDVYEVGYLPHKS